MGTLAEELYSSDPVNVELDSSSSVPNHSRSPYDGIVTGNDSTQDDDFVWASDDNFEASYLDREWGKRHEEFQTIGYRDGIIAGKEASAQPGFNIGFKESVKAGYRWGLIRGVTSAVALLPYGMREKLMETDIKRAQLQRLYESTSYLSSTDALKSFYDDVVSKRGTESANRTASSSTSESLLDNYYRELSTFLKESPKINIQPMMDS